jgi:hypothetical protein
MLDEAIDLIPGLDALDPDVLSDLVEDLAPLAGGVLSGASDLSQLIWPSLQLIVALGGCVLLYWRRATIQN